MKIETLTSEYLGSHSYLLIERNHAIIIDIGDSEKVIHKVYQIGVTVDFCILTHEHCDHIMGCSNIREKFTCKVYASFACNKNMSNEKTNFSRYYNAFVSIQEKYSREQQKEIIPFTEYADEVFCNEMIIEWQGHKILLHETPGHSLGSICVLVDNEYLFSGDTLLKDDLTGVNFVGSNKEQLLKETIPWLKRLNGNIMVYPGHGNSFILKERLARPII